MVPSLSLLMFFVVTVLAAGPLAWSQEASTPEDGKYLLRYKFQKGETLRWKVTHLAITETSVKGNSQESESRCVSTKAWHIDSINEKGDVTFTHSVEHVEMRQKVSGRPEVTYNSAEGGDVPAEYQQVAKTVGVPLTKVTISAEGKLIERKSNTRQPNFGLGDIVMLLPPKPVGVGSKWYEPSEIQIRQPDERVKRIKVRKSYTLKKVKTGVATIDVRTEVLTPIDEASVKSQLVQQLVNGTIKFDLDAGRILSRRMDWDEAVIGFSGPESMMKYLARFTEEPLSDRTAKREDARRE